MLATWRNGRRGLGAHERLSSNALQIVREAMRNMNKRN
jgi:hypothetical protein